MHDHDWHFPLLSVNTLVFFHVLLSKAPRVKIKKLESFVENMGVKLKDEELEELMTQLSADGECQTSLCSSEKH